MNYKAIINTECDGFGGGSDMMNGHRNVKYMIMRAKYSLYRTVTTWNCVGTSGSKVLHIFTFSAGGTKEINFKMHESKCKGKTFP